MNDPMLPVDPATMPGTTASGVLWVVVWLAGGLFVIGLALNIYYRWKEDRNAGQEGRRRAAARSRGAVAGATGRSAARPVGVGRRGARGTDVAVQVGRGDRGGRADRRRHQGRDGQEVSRRG